MTDHERARSSSRLTAPGPRAAMRSGPARLLVLSCLAVLVVGCSAPGRRATTGETERPGRDTNTTARGTAQPTRDDPSTRQDRVGSDRIPVGEVELVLIASLDAPVAMTSRHGTDDLYVAEQTGRVRRLTRPAQHGTGPPGVSGSEMRSKVEDEPVLDLSNKTDAGGERGLLGLTFSPDGTMLYVDYTDITGDTQIVEYRMQGDRAVASSARVLLTVEQPYENHNGGELAFGPDGMLYIAMGDGGSGGDPEDRAQDTSQLLGKILRIDPTPAADGRPYSIPGDNPFVDGGGRPEIWIYGVRNPWRFSFDSGDSEGDLWVADVGQESREEIDLLRSSPGGAGRGANLGWPLFEGTRPFKARASEDPASGGMVPPIYEYGHDSGACSIIGGHVYRGSAIPALRGIYVFGDYCSARLLALRPALDGDVEVADLGVAVAGYSLSSFGLDAYGELYVLSTTGSVYKLVAPSGS